MFSLIATFLFFFEYVPPIRQVFIPFDLPVYHFSLADYAFQSLKQGRFPQWDPTIYSGMDFPSNVQAALFYPPTWLMFAANWGRSRLSYQSLEDLTFAHVWLGFLLCFLWLRTKHVDGRRIDPFAALLGAMAYGFSGFVCLNVQHFGLIAAYAWFPLGLWGIDQAAEAIAAGDGRWWRPLWKLVAASALIFVAGYPPLWFVYGLFVAMYGAGKWWIQRRDAHAGALLFAIAASMGISLVLCAVQLLPSLEATGFRRPEAQYGLGLEWRVYLSYFLPNYYDFGMDRPLDTNPGKEYLYLGDPALFGMGALLAGLLRRRIPGKAVLPGFLAMMVCLIVSSNPFNIVWEVIQHSTLLSDVIRAFYFLAGVAIGIAELSAWGLDSFLNAAGRGSQPAWIERRGVRLAIVLLGVWGFGELMRWPNDYAARSAKALMDPIAMLAIWGGGLFILREQRGSHRGEARAWLMVALIVSCGIDYKVFGTSKRFNAAEGPGPRFFDQGLAGMSTGIDQLLRNEKVYRVLLDDYAPFPIEMRHIGLRTPQGFDPLLTEQYRDLVDKMGKWRSDRDFVIDLANDEALQLFGIKYIISAEQSPWFPQLFGDKVRFRELDDKDGFYRVFEYLPAKPPFGWVSHEPSDQLRLTGWTPERRAFRVQTRRGGQLTLAEQRYPGWTVAIDGLRQNPDRWQLALQEVQIPAGEHTVVFEYRSTWLRTGAWISLLTLAGLGAAGIAPRRRRWRLGRG